MSHNMFVGSGKRSGTRGGADQFSWDKVKGDKYKDFYLGHSLHTTAKPTFNNRKPNPLWWTKAHDDGSTGVDDEARRRAEIEAIKREEEQLHLEALGLAPRRRKAQENQLDSNEIQELTRRGNTERDAYDAERVAGLGFAPAPQHQKEAALLPLARPSEGQVRTGADDGVTDDTERKEETKDAKEKSKHKHRDKDRKSTRKEKEERKEEKRRRKEEKRKRKETRSLDKRKESSVRTGDEHKNEDRGRAREGAARDDRRTRRSSSRSPKRRHGDERRSRRDGDTSRSPKRRRRHDSPSPPPLHRHRSRHGSP